jgi:hypothetical protein
MATGLAAYDPKNVIGSLPTVDDSVANQVTALASKDSEINRMAQTEGLKAANRRGLLNSSMAVGASQDAVLANVIPIASQEAAQAFQKNQAARAFEFGMAGQLQGQEWQSAENVAQRGWQTGERLGAESFQHGEGLLERDWQAGENVAAREWQTAENIAQRGFLGTQAQLDRDLEKLLQKNQITSQEKLTFAQIASTEGIEKANRALSLALQEKDIAFRMKEGNLDRASAELMQKRDIAFQTQQGELTRDLQEQIAKWNLGAAEQEGAARLLTSMETMYQSTYQSIMNNTALDATTRNKYLASAKNLRNYQINFVEQLYNVDLKWDEK